MAMQNVRQRGCGKAIALPPSPAGDAVRLLIDLEIGALMAAATMGMLF